tara:strand:- start:1050 stop:1571 length:522 start_codon:yes stop_codon:yes gene_type:complete
VPRRKTVKNHHGQRGVCININCTEPRDTIIISKKGIPTYRSDCHDCHLADIGYVQPSTGKLSKYKKGVIRVKLNHCQNKFGTAQLCDSFECMTIHKVDGTLDQGELHLDHIDGRHENNVPENCQTLCSSCHSKKTKLNGDTRSCGGNKHFGYSKETKQNILITPLEPIDHDFF